MKFIYLPTFVKRIKELSKKYPSIKNHFLGLLKALEVNPRIGTEPGKDYYKNTVSYKKQRPWILRDRLREYNTFI